jgi:hypothetical protein
LRDAVGPANRSRLVIEPFEMVSRRLVDPVNCRLGDKSPWDIHLSFLSLAQSRAPDAVLFEFACRQATSQC